MTSSPTDDSNSDEEEEEELPPGTESAGDFMLVAKEPMYSKTMNKEYALPPEKSFAQISDEQTGAEPTTRPDKVRPDHKSRADDLADPWTMADRKYVHNDGFEERYSTMPLEGFDIYMGRDPYRASAAEMKNTTINYMT